MLPLKLVMEGFISFKNRTVIDFTNLNEDSIYLITGPTGAGKTTIFDAITYALFGEAAGNERKSTKEYRSHLTTEKDNFEVELTFMQNDVEYIVRRYIKGGTKTFKTALIIDGDEENPIVKINDIKEKIENILGLSMNQFKKIVMLPQGDFRSFLNADPKEKADILRKLFNVEKLSAIKDGFNNRYNNIKNKIKEKENIISSEKQRLNDTKELLNYDEIKIVIDKLEEDSKLEIEKLKIGKIDIEKDLTIKENELEKAFEINEKIKKHEVNLKNYEDLKSKELEYNSILEKANLLTSLKPGIPIKNNINTNREKVKDNKERLDSLLDWKEKNKNKFKEISLEYSKLGNYEENLKNLEESIRNLKDKEKAGRLIEESLIKVKSVNEKIEHLKVVVKELEKIKEERENNFEVMSKVNEDFQKESLEEKKLLVWENELSKIIDIEEEILKLKLDIKSEEERQINLNKELNELKEKEEELSKKLLILKEEDRLKGLEAYVDLLHEGEPCPLCGNVVENVKEHNLNEDVIDEIKIIEELIRKNLHTIGVKESELSNSKKRTKDSSDKQNILEKDSTEWFTKYRESKNNTELLNDTELLSNIEILNNLDILKNLKATAKENLSNAKVKINNLETLRIKLKNKDNELKKKESELSSESLELQRLLQEKARLDEVIKMGREKFKDDEMLENIILEIQSSLKKEKELNNL